MAASRECHRGSAIFFPRMFPDVDISSDEVFAEVVIYYGSIV